MSDYKTDFEKDLDYFLNKYYPNDYELIKSGDKEMTDKMKEKYIEHFIKRKKYRACEECKQCKQYVDNNMTKQGCFGDVKACEEYER